MSSSPRLFRFARPGPVLLIAGVWLAPGQCGGALSWESRKIEVTAELESTSAAAVFHFKNAGNEPVTITDIKPSCGCTAVDLAKRAYVPGEAGEIKTVTTFGGSLGTQEKNLVITTSDAPLHPVTLVLRYTIPELFTYNPRLLLWRLNETPEEKSAVITCQRELAGIEVSPEAQAQVTCRVEPVEAGKSYRIFIKPKSLSESVSVPVPLVARLTDHTTRPLVLYVLVR